jgi:septum formation protein
MLYLASQSPRRRHLLEQVGVVFTSLDIEVPEVRGADELPLDYVSRVARDKAIAGLDRVSGMASAMVLAADTEVVLDDEVFGKPVDKADAVAMLRRLSGYTHEVISVVWLVDAQHEERAISVSTVRFAEIDEATIARYVATGEPMGKAGAYAIQGAAATFIEHLAGSYSGVMGLPLFETSALLRSFGVQA